MLNIKQCEQDGLVCVLVNRYVPHIKGVFTLVVVSHLFRSKLDIFILAFYMYKYIIICAVYNGSNVISNPQKCCCHARCIDLMYSVQLPLLLLNSIPLDELRRLDSNHTFACSCSVCLFFPQILLVPVQSPKSCRSMIIVHSKLTIGQSVSLSLGVGVRVEKSPRCTPPSPDEYWVWLQLAPS